MSNKIVIDIDTKYIKTAQHDLTEFQKSLVRTKHVVNKLNKSKVMINIEGENNKFLQSLDKMNVKLRECQDMLLFTFYDVKGSVARLVDDMYLMLQSFTRKSFKVRIGIENNLSLNQVKRLKENRNSISNNVSDTRKLKLSQQRADIWAEKKETKDSQRLPKRKNFKDKVEDIKEYFNKKRRGFEVDPIGTAFSSAIEGIDYVGRFLILKDGVKKIKNLKQLRQHNNNPTGTRPGADSRNNRKFSTRFFGEDSRIRKGLRSAKQFVRGKIPATKEGVKNFGSKTKSVVTSGGARTARVLKNLGGNAKYLVTNNAGKVARGGAALGGKALRASTQLVTKLGAAGTAGAAVTVLGVADGAKDFYKGIKAENKYDKKYEMTKGAAKMGSTVAGAVAGSMILPGLGTIVGGIGGYLVGKFGGEKAAEKIAGGSKGAAKYADQSENAAIKVAKDSSSAFEKLQFQLADTQGKEERSDLISDFTVKMSDTTKALIALAEKNEKAGKEIPKEVQDYFTKMDHLKLMGAGLDLPERFRKQKAQAGADKKVGSVALQQKPIPTELQIDGNKVINGQSPITPEELGVPPFLSTTTDVYCKINRIIGEPPANTKGTATKGRRTKGTGKTIASGLDAASKVVKGAFKVLNGLRSDGIVGGSYPGFAEGGYVHGGAQLITVAEEGTPEAIIPLGKHRRKRAMELFNQVGSYLQAPGFTPKGFAAGGIVGGSIGSGFGGGATVVEVGGVEIKVEAKDGQNLVETIRENKEAISEEIAGVFNAAFKGQFANTPASGGISA